MKKIGGSRVEQVGGALAALGGVMLLGAAACTVESAPPPRRPAYYPPPPSPGYAPGRPPPPGYYRPAPPPPRPAPPQLGYNPPPYAPQAPAPPPPPTYAAPQAPPAAVFTLAPPLNLMHPAPLPVLDAINVQAVAMAAARSGRTCGPRQVAPNVWVQIDCLAYNPILAAIPHMSALKLAAMDAKSPTFRALNLQSLLPQLAMTSAATSFPATVDHRSDGGEGPVKDQGMVGDCTAFSLSSVMENQLRRARMTSTVSPSHLWSHYGNPDMAKAGDSNLKKGITTFELWPYSGKEACELETDSDPDCVTAYGVQTNTWQSDPQAKAHETAAEATGQIKISEIDKLTIPANIQEMESVLSSGSDIWAGMRIDSNAWTNAGQKGSTIPDWALPDGGHAVAISGYRTGANGQTEFLVHNSWGSSWGDKGYAWISQNMVTLFLQYAYKVKVAGGGGGVGPAASPVVPITPAVVTDDDCDASQLIDYFSGQCALICPNGTRPTNGKCH